MNRTITQAVILLRTFADELETLLQQTVAAPQGEVVVPAPKRTRGPNKPKEPEQPADFTSIEKPASTGEVTIIVPESEGLSLDALKALIEPAVKGGIGKQVKDLIAKHGGSQLSDLPAAAHAAFAADVEALVY